MVCAIECRQRLPAFRGEFRDIGVSDVAKHFRGSDGSIGVMGVTLTVTLTLLRWARCLHLSEQNRAVERLGR